MLGMSSMFSTQNRAFIVCTPFVIGVLMQQSYQRKFAGIGRLFLAYAPYYVPASALVHAVIGAGTTFGIFLAGTF